MNWRSAQDATDNVDFYNVLLHNQPDPGATAAASVRITNATMLFRAAFAQFVQRVQTQSLDALMNGAVRQKLGVTIPASVTWGAQASSVFSALSNDFMQDVVGGVDRLLKRNFPVVVYSGQLDLICATAGTEAWLRRLTWPGAQAFQQALRLPVYADETQNTAAFVKSAQNLTYFYIMNAGSLLTLRPLTRVVSYLNLFVS